MKHSVLVTEIREFTIEVDTHKDANADAIERQAIKLFEEMSNSDREDLQWRVLSVAGEYNGKVPESWSGEQQATARRQGWEIYTELNGRVCVQAVGQVGSGGFANSKAAWLYVQFRAEQGDDLPAAAVAYIEERNTSL